jgi:hypothetical protein
LPNLFIVGAPKAGTTSIVKYLEIEGSVYFPSIKEPHFLYASKVVNNIPNVVTSINDYKNLYPKKGYKYYGDASVFGLLYYNDTISSILSLYGKEVPIIIVLRDPVERAYSAYLQAKRYNSKELLKFDEAFFINQRRNDISPMMHYFECSLYYEAVKAYKDNFKKVKIIYSYDLFRDTYTTMKDLYDFLCLDKSCLESKKLIIHNEGGKDLQGFIKIFLMKKIFNQSFRQKLKKISPKLHNVLKKGVFRYIYTKSDNLTKEKYNYYLSYFEEDIQLLYNLLEDIQIKKWTKR